jgi:DNA-directed RNA polymerase subunit RPC12/RpoP
MLSSNIMKKCTLCSESKTLDDFYINRNSEDGHQTLCKSCSKRQSTAWRNQNKLAAKKISTHYLTHNKDRIRDNELQRKYNVSLQEVLRIFTEQDNRCGICKKEITLYHVDHDHATGKFRGVLCPNCNHLLGHAKDNIDILQNSIDYLNNNKLDK